MLYNGVNNAVHPPEGGATEIGGLSASSLPEMHNAPSDTNARRPAKKSEERQSQQLINTVGLISGARTIFGKVILVFPIRKIFTIMFF